MLKREGHTVSYDGVCRIEFVVASQVRPENRKEGDAYLTSNIFPDIFSHSSMNNIDIYGDTRCGQGTTHVLGSLIFQDGRPYTTFTNLSMKYHLMCKVYTDVGGIK